jgi:signal transduction histidine kinase
MVGLRMHLERTELVLDVLAALLTVAVAILAVRALRQYASVLHERNRLQAMRAAELEQFAGRVAHDIRGPLGTASMALELCLADAPLDETRARLERGARGISRVTSIIEGLLRFARAGARPEPGVTTRIQPVVADLLAELTPVAAERAIDLRAESVADTAVTCNSGVLASLLENLVRNAIKYMGTAPVRRVCLRAGVCGDHVRFEVEDSGPGIPPDVLPNVFEPYVRGHDGQPGIGLGLVTVRRIAEAHGGAVSVRSTPAGSTFAVDLLCG